MPTFEVSPPPDRRRTRFRTRLLALEALIVIAISILFLSPTSTHRTPTPTTYGHDPSTLPAALTTRFSPSAVRDPTTHALLRVRPAGRRDWPTLASVLRPLTPKERWYVLGITSLTPLELWAAFGTSPTPPARYVTGSAHASTATTSPPVASPILPACAPGPCWRGAHA